MAPPPAPAASGQSSPPPPLPTRRFAEPGERRPCRRGHVGHGAGLDIFALEPRDELMASARAKLDRKKIDMVVGNPLETMDGETIEAVVLGRDGTENRTSGAISKVAFGGWLMDLIESRAGSKS